MSSISSGEFLERSLAGYFRIGPDGCFQEVNPAWLDMHGYIRDEVIGRHFSLTQVGMDMPTADMVIRQLFSGDPIPSGEFSRLRKDGSIGHHMFAAYPVCEGERIVAVEGFLLDTTRQKQLEIERGKSEEVLRRTQTRYYELFNAMINGVALHEIICDDQGRPVDYRFLAVNPAFEAMTGLKATDIIGRRILEIAPTTERHWIETYGQVAITGTPVHFENYWQVQDRYYEVTAYRPASGQFVCVFADISERKRAEINPLIDARRLRSVDTLSRTAFATAKDLLDRAIEEITALSGSVFGYIYYYSEDRQEFTLHAWSKSVMPACSIPNPPSTYALTKTGIWGEAVRQRQSIIVNDFPAPNPLKKGYPEGHAHLKRFMTVPVFAEGSIVAVAGVANKNEPYTDGDVSQLTQFMATIWNMVERKKADEELRILNAELERRVKERTDALAAANHELESFSYTVSHDLRAPLRHILGFIGLIAERPVDSLDAETRGHLDTIGRSAHRMARLIDDLLAFSRMGRSALTFMPCNFNQLVREVVTELERDQPGRSLSWEIGELPVIDADHALMRQVFANLLGNAVKYTSRSERAVISVKAIIGSNEATITVADSGVGFDMRHADKLFGVFQRLHSDKEFEGTGIGLAHVQRIIHRHNGSIRGEGVLGKGAVFHLTLPMKQGDGFGTTQ